MKLISTAWKNMWRNRGRTLISGSAIFITTLIVCFVLSLENGFIEDIKTNVRTNISGDVRIMSRKYLDNERINPLQFFVEDTRGTIDALSKNPLVSLATPRSEFMVSIYRNGEQIPARAIGIDMERAPLFSSKNNRMVEGTVPAPGSQQVLVVEGLAEELGLEVGSKFTAITRTAIGGSNGKTFTVSGVISMSDMDFSGRLFFMDWTAAGEYLRMDGNALQIQLFLKERKELDAAAASVTNTLAEAGYGKKDSVLDVRPWYDINGIFQMIEMMDVMYVIIGSIFYLLAGTVIFNTTMMAVLERKKEIGTLGALGMERGRIVLLFLGESGLIALTGTVIGLVCGIVMVAAFGKAGFNVEAIYGTAGKGMSYSRIVYPSLMPYQVAEIFLMGVSISLAACLIPARMAAGIEPADALADR